MHLLSAGDLIDRSTEFYRRHFVLTLKIISWNIIIGLTAALTETYLAWRFPNGSALSTILIALASLASLLVSIATMSRLISSVTAVVNNQPLPTWKSVFKNFLPIFAAVMLSVLLIVLGLTVFIVPGIIFWIWFAFAPVITALGESNWRQSFGKSRLVSHGRFGMISWRLIAPFGFFALLQLVLLLVATLLIQGAGRGLWTIELIVEGAPLWLLLLANLASELVRDLLSPLFVFALTILYLAAKEETNPVEPKPGV
jgi:hypothetical protein